MGYFGSLPAEIGSEVWRIPANFNGFRVLPSLLQRRRSPEGGQPNFARCLAVSWAGTLYIHFSGAFAPDEILLGAKFTFRPSLAFSYIGSVTARHSSSGRQPNFAAWYTPFPVTLSGIQGHFIYCKPFHFSAAAITCDMFATNKFSSSFSSFPQKEDWLTLQIDVRLTKVD